MENQDMFTQIINGLLQELNGPNGEALAMGFVGLTMVLMFIAAIAAIGVLIKVICRWRIFSKAGDKGWKALIPVYNGYTEYKLTWIGWLYFIAVAAGIIAPIITAVYPEGFLCVIGSLIGLTSTVLAIMQRHKLSVAFGHGIGFTIGLIFLEMIFMLILAFGRSEYKGVPAK